MKRVWFIVIWTILFANGCGKSGSDSFGILKKRVDVTPIASVWGNDESDSCRSLQSDFNRCRANMVVKSQPSQVWLCISINSLGFSDQNFICAESAAMPEDKTILQAKLKKVRKKLMDAVLNHQPAFIDTKGTDVYSFLYFAQLKLKDYPHHEKRIIILSDLDDTLGKERDVDLSGISVYCLFVAHPKGDISKWEKKVEQWTEFFTRMGADRVVIKDPSQSISFIPE